MPKYYPALMNLEDRNVLVIGGGVIAARKATTLLEYGARVVIVAPELSPEVSQLASNINVQIHRREFQDGDLDNVVLVIAATDNRDLHIRVSTECRRRNLPCNVVDDPELCSFIVPSIIRRGELMVTISTDGLCPAYSKMQRLRLERELFPAGSEAMLHVIAAARNELRNTSLTDEEKFQLLRQLAEGDLSLILEREGEQNAKEEAIRRIRAMLGRHIPEST